MLRAGTGAMPGYGYQGFPTPSRFELRQPGSVSSYSRCVCVPSLSYFTPVRQICATAWRPALLEKGIYRHLLSLPSLRYGRPQSTMMREETNKVRRSDVARRSAHFRKWIEVGFQVPSCSLSFSLSLLDMIFWDNTPPRSLLLRAKYPYCKQHESLG